MAESSPEAAQEGLKAWMEWAGRAGGGIVDLGNPLADGREVTASGTPGANSHVGGYAIIQAEDLDGAQSLLAGHPHLMMPNASIQVYDNPGRTRHIVRQPKRHSSPGMNCPLSKPGERLPNEPPTRRLKEFLLRYDGHDGPKCLYLDKNPGA
jgi:hypothetical protein